MERLRERIAIARRALETLRQLPLSEKVDAVTRDAAIQRFEYSFEAVWKAIQLFLREIEGLDIGSPKGVVRASFRVGLLDENQADLAPEMVDDHNLTVHTHNETLAEEIYKHIAGYTLLMDLWLKAVEGRIGHESPHT